jgi:PAS domain S-box-containing protein
MRLTDGEILYNTVLRAPIGICILDADTLIAEFVNEKFIEVAGKPYDAIFGRFYWDAFAEARPYYEKALALVVRSGEAYYADEVEMMLIRHGREETIFVTFVYTSVTDKDGNVIKVAVWVLENTKQVNERQKTEAARNAFKQERDRFKGFFMQAPAGICMLDGPNLVYELVNADYQQLFPGRALLGKPLLEAVPEIEGSAIWDILHEVYLTGKTYEGNELLIPLARTTGAPVDDRYFNFTCQAMKSDDGSIDGIMVFVKEITEMVRVKLLIEASDKRHNFLLNTMPQQVWTARPNGELDYVNQVVCEDFGYTSAEILGKGWQEFIHPDDLPLFLASWSEALNSGKDYMVEFRLKFRDGSYYWHLARAVPFIEDGVIKSWFGTNTNINSRKENEYRKDEFLSIASHELKTPLTNIKAYNQIMKKLEVTEKVKPFIDKSADHIARLERLINDLLDVTKINAGKVSYTMEPFNFAQLLIDSVESMKYTAPKHQLILTSNPDIIYNGDRNRLEQVLNNFLSNAIKYSPEATQVIIGSYVDHDNIIVSVQDFGIGIVKENLDKLFDRYYRVDNTAMRFEGLGLGLFISAEILRRHGGSFWIESEPGAGSTFYFRLPLGGPEKQEVTRTATYYRDRRISINYNSRHNRLDVDWTGFHDMESVKQGCMIMWDLLEKNKCDRIVNDNTHVLGNWSEAAEWVGNVWFPMMEKSGLKYFAHVFSSSTFSQLSARKSIDIMAGIITTQYFTDIELAEEWVNRQDT